MPIDTVCLGCGQRLRVADEHAGKKARCPNCQTINPIPGGEVGSLGTQPSPDPYAPKPLPDAYRPAGAPTTAAASPLGSPFVSASAAQPTTSDAQELWTLKTDDGSQYGPVQRPQLDQWFGEGRVTPACQLMSSRENRWRAAGEIFPSLGIPTAQPATPQAGSNPFSDHAQTFAPNPYASGNFTAPGNIRPRTWSQPHNGVVILVLGLIGCVFCALLGPVAAFMGHQSLGEIKRGRMDPEGHGLVLAGTILGWIGCVQLLFVCAMFGLMIVAAAVDA